MAWHVLNANDGARATASYVEQFGWALSGRVDLGAHGDFQQFAWHAGGENVGAIGDVAARPGVHPHWLFFFETESLDLSIAAVRGRGGQRDRPPPRSRAASVFACATTPKGRRLRCGSGSHPGPRSPFG